jgi:hypothetical protein
VDSQNAKRKWPLLKRSRTKQRMKDNVSKVRLAVASALLEQARGFLSAAKPAANIFKM